MFELSPDQRHSDVILIIGVRFELNRIAVKLMDLIKFPEVLGVFFGTHKICVQNLEGSILLRLLH